MKHRSLAAAAFFGAALILSLPAAAQIAPGGVVNIASWKPFGSPGAGIAQGAGFIIVGTNLAPAGLNQASFPLPNSLGGVTVRAAVGGTTVDCPIIYTSPGQLAVLLPSNTPAGTGTVTVNNNGTSHSHPIDVVRRAFGMFTKNQGGSGSAIFQNFVSSSNTPVNGPVVSANPNQTGILWGAGLGAVSGAEASSVGLTLTATPNVEIYVGNQRVSTIRYAGRSGCCAGIDQIVFDIPAGVSGCSVPVVVIADGVPSNTATISIATSGQTCSDPGGLTATELQSLFDGTARLGTVNLSKVSARISAGGFDATSTIDLAAAIFQEYPSALYEARGAGQTDLSPGSCVVTPFTGENAPPDPIAAAAKGLNAGTITVTNNSGASQTLDQKTVGNYDKLLAQTTSVSGLPGGIPGSTPAFIGSGTHTFRATGGADVGAFTIAANIGNPLTWTNRDSITAVDRANGVRITWTGGAANDWGFVTGSSVNRNSAGRTYGATFLCRFPVSAGNFTVPSYILQQLPPSENIQGTATGALIVGNSSNPVRFNATGLDLGIFVFSTADSKTGLAYR